MPELENEAPTFPPLLSGHSVAMPTNPVEFAVAAAADKIVGAGDLFWSTREDRLTFALVLEPEVSRTRCAEMLYVAMVGFGDAAGALMPPEVSLTYQWPSSLLVNEGYVGSVDLHLPSSETHISETDAEIPDWMVLSVDIELRPSEISDNPGLTYDRTTLWEEGCGHISRTDLLNATSRHLLTWMHNWEEEGFKPVHDQWMQRLQAKEDISIPYDGKTYSGDLMGLDDTGNAIFRREKSTDLLQTFTALLDRRSALEK